MIKYTDVSSNECEANLFTKSPDPRSGVDLYGQSKPELYSMLQI